MLPTDDYVTKLEELKEYFEGIYGEDQKIENDISPDSTEYTWRVSLTDKQIFDIEAFYNKKDIQETGIKQ